MQFTRPRRIKYPTGFVARRWELTSPSGRIRIEIEETVAYAPGQMRLEDIGDYTVTGSCIPRGATGPICHETLPCVTIRRRWYGQAAALRRAKAIARKWYRTLLPQCETV